MLKQKFHNYLGSEPIQWLFQIVKTIIHAVHFPFQPDVVVVVVSVSGVAFGIGFVSRFIETGAELWKNLNNKISYLQY